MNLPSKKKILIISFGILIIFSLSFYQSNVKNFFYLISQSFQRDLWAKGGNISDFFESLFKSGNLKKENEELKKSNQELLGKIVSFQGLEEENKTLREALDIGLRQDFKLILADLIGKDFSGDFILINKGVKDGLNVGMPVVTAQKVLLGKISEVSENFSRVTLISHPENSFPVQVQEEKVTGVVKGGGNSQLFLEKIPHNQEIKEGDLIVTTSLGGTFPEGFLIGKVQKVQKNDIESFQTIEISPFLNIKELKTVFVITNF